MLVITLKVNEPLVIGINNKKVTLAIKQVQRKQVARFKIDAPIDITILRSNALVQEKKIRERHRTQEEIAKDQKKLLKEKV